MSRSPEQGERSRGESWGARLSWPASAVWATWAALTVPGLAFVGAFGRNCPFMDEWEFVEALAPDTPLGSWAFQAHGEHRYPVPRLLYAGLFRLTGDLRCAMVLNVLALSAAAAGLILAARRARGRTAWADMFFPLALLHAGHWEDVLMAYQVNFTGGVVLIAVLLAVASVPPREWGWPAVAAAGGAAALLPGYGVPGVIYGAAAAVWLGTVGWFVIRHHSPARAAVLVLCSAVATVGVTLYVVNRGPSPFADLPRRWLELVQVGARMPAAAFGAGTRAIWPGVAAVVAVVAVGVGRALWKALRSGDRSAAAGLVALLLAGAVLVGGLVWGRGWAGPDVAFMPRYAALAFPLLAGLALAAIRFGGPGLATLGPAALAAVALVSWPLNLDHGLFHARRISHHTDDLVAEYRAGWPAALLFARHDWQVIQSAPLTRSQFDRLGGIRGLAFGVRGPELVVRTVRLTDPAVTGVNGAEDTPYGVSGPGHEAAIRIPLPLRDDLIAVKVTGRFVPPELCMARYRVRWKPAGSDRWEEERFQIGRAVEMSVVARATGPVEAVEVIPDESPWCYSVTAVELYVTDRSRTAEPRP